MADMILVENLDKINRSLARSGPLVAKAQRMGLREAAQPVRLDAERLARSEISGMRRSRKQPPPWSEQRIGQTVHEIYIAPRQRGVKSRTDRSRRRPNFAVLMLGKSYEPALERNQVLVRNTVDAWLGRIVREI